MSKNSTRKNDDRTQELVSLLAELGFLDKSLMNPWTGTLYSGTMENDWFALPCEQPCGDL